MKKIKKSIFEKIENKLSMNLTAVLLTLILGSGTFFLLSQTIFLDKPGFPTQLNDGIGDTFILTLFNGFLFRRFKLYKNRALISAILGIFIAAIYTYYQLHADYTDWSKPAIGVLNFGGWYHSIFFAVQSSLIAYGILTQPKNCKLWICLGCYLLISLAQLLLFGYI